MSDPIGNIIWGEDYFSNPHDDEIIKQIRQRIGRELLSKADLYGDKEGVYTAVKALDIREVCQMEES